MKKILFILILAFSSFLPMLNAQMVVGQDTLYGNEWIDHTQSYCKILGHKTVSGMVKLTYSELISTDTAFRSVKGSQLRMFYMGKEIPIYVSTTGTLNNTSFIEFYSRPQPVYIDKFLHRSDTSWFSPKYSYVQDAAPYFLTWSSISNITSNPPKRYTDDNNGMTLTPLPPKQLYFVATTGSPFYKARFDLYSPGEPTGNNATLGGYESRGFAQNNTYDPSPAKDKIVSKYVYLGAGAPAAQLTCRVKFTENRSHDLRIKVNGTEYLQFNKQGYDLRNHNATIPLSALRDTNNVEVDGVAGQYDYIALASAVLSYPRQFNFGNASTFDFVLEANPNAPTYFEITNFNYGNTAPILYDHTNGKRIETLIENGLIKFVLPISQDKRAMTLRTNTTSATNYFIMGYTTLPTDLISASTVRLRPIKMRNFRQPSNQGNYIIVSHKNLFYDDGQADNWVKSYAEYRKSALGGGFDTLTIEMSELANVFSYGVDLHPMAIRNMTHFAKRHFTGAKAPKYVFLIGKGNHSHRQRAVDVTTLVPTFGFPSSDNAMMGSNFSNIPIIPFGRLAAWEGKDVKNYLVKVKEHEQLQAAPSNQSNKAWMKNAMHLVGARDEPSIPVYMNGYKNILEAPMYGGNVYTFRKNTTNPTSLATGSLIDSLITTGVSLVNMFGHAYSNGTDFNLDPGTMNNSGKYPLVISLGCYSGDMFTPIRALSERFVLAPQKAGIGFIGGVDLNLPPLLDIFSVNLYRNLSTTLYGKGIGDIMQKTIADAPSNDAINQNINFHGDPAVKLSWAAKPDFVIKQNSLHINPTQITTLTPSFKVEFTVLNIGKSVTDSINLTVKRTKPGGGVTTTKLRVKAPAFTGTYTAILQTGTNQIIGANTIDVCVDDPNVVSEIEENNNCASIDFQIYSNRLFPVYPPNFGIHPNNTVTLKATSTNPLGTKGNYTLEIDTNEEFLSPQRGNIANFTGGLLEWQVPNYTLSDSTVYYWRIKVTGDTVWQNSSFIYLKDEYPGWNQSHYYQYNYDKFTNVFLPKNPAKFKFVDNNSELSLYASHVPNYTNQVFQNGATLYNTVSCFDTVIGGVYIVAFNPLTGETLDNSPVSGEIWSHGSRNCTTYPQGWFFPLNDAASGANGLSIVDTTYSTRYRDSLERFLTQWIPDGYHVLVWTRGNYRSNKWKNSLFQALEIQGATKIRGTVTKNGPYAFFYQKNQNNFPNRKEISKDIRTPIENEKFIIPGAWYQGGISSTLIGPAYEWGSFHWRTSSTQPSDVLSVDVYGVKGDQSDSLLFSKLTLRDKPINNINAKVFPYLRLKWNTKDSTSRSSAHLDYWRVLFKQIPEAVLRPEKYFAFELRPDSSVSLGEKVTLEIAVENITATNMDSLRTRYVVSKGGVDVATVNKKFAPLPGGGRINTSFTYNTLPLQDRQQSRSDCGIYIDVNPEKPDSLHQTELYHFNNTGFKKFFVEQDNKNPLLDVTFDSQHILNNDIVSSKPEILITLKDENQFLALADTSRFKLFLDYPPGTYNGNTQTEQVRVYLNQSNVTFRAPAPNELARNNKAWIRFTPTFEKDGTYRLTAQGKDAADNPSGAQDYNVNFRIVNKSAISNILNYPNPFSSVTQFVFTITGGEVPSDLRIQIMTVTGKVVRELTKAELGPIHVGLNRTEFAWDGTDQYGDKLANGVYLYRVTARNAAGEDYELSNDSENGGKLGNYFQAGFGKMYLMR